VNSVPDNSRVSLLPYLVPLSYFLILVTRSYPSMGRLPADPGYDYVLNGSEQGLSALTLGDPYFHVGARLLALVTSWFPLAYQAVVLSVLVHVVWSICAVVIANVIATETRKRWLGYLAGCFLIAAPHASESGLGNVGNVKWPLLAALLVVSGSRTSIQTFPKSVALLAVTTGFTQPLTILCGIPLVVDVLRIRRITREQLTLGVLLAGTASIQIAKVGIDSAASGQSTKVTAPWEGMGLFWWSGFVGPIAMSAACLTVLLLRRAHVDVWWVAVKLSLAAGVVALASYRMGGIADRYFIVPMTLAVVALFITVQQLFAHMPKWRMAGTVALLIGLAIPTTKWFSSGPYLMTPPIWKSEVNQATQFCRANATAMVTVSSSVHGGNELACSYILRG
jgi:hypothetical protein